MINCGFCDLFYDNVRRDPRINILVVTEFDIHMLRHIFQKLD